MANHLLLNNRWNFLCLSLLLQKSVTVLRIFEFLRELWNLKLEHLYLRLDFKVLSFPNSTSISILDLLLNGDLLSFHFQLSNHISKMLNLSISWVEIFFGIHAPFLVGLKIILNFHCGLSYWLFPWIVEIRFEFRDADSQLRDLRVDLWCSWFLKVRL